MRIIAGTLKGRPLKAPPGPDTRPTADRTREAIFSLLLARRELHDAAVLDLFAGTGALALEAISRGAAYATLVESLPAAARVARDNARALGVEDACVFVRADAVRYAATYRGPAFDLVFADPPYELSDLTRLPELVLPHLTPDGFFVLEHDRRHSFDEHPALVTSRAYGRTVVSLFERLVDPPGDTA